MDYKDLLKNRRSVRSFTAKKVPLKILHEIIQDTCLAPSACNGQLWRFIIIQDVILMKKLSDESKKNGLIELKNNPNSLYKRFENLFKNPDSNLFYDATSLVFICGIKGLHTRENCSLAAAYFMLAATERELAICWIGLADKIIDPNLSKEIGLSDDLEIVAPIIIGYPTKIPGVPKRTPIILKEVENN